MENDTRAKMAEKVSNDIFKFFRWETVFVKNRDFACCKQSEHKPPQKSQEHTHPVDVVFHYIDPYTGKRVYLNTDVKSYAKSSVTVTAVRAAINSLRDTLDCAKNSAEWKEKYHEYEDMPAEVRGMLFVYNHDGGFDKDFNLFFRKNSKRGSHISLAQLGVKNGHYLHVFSPEKISYITSILNDIKNLKGDKKFPGNDNFSFYYPELRLHKEHVVDAKKRAATIEMLCSSFFIIKHGAVTKRNKKGEKVRLYEKGYIVYYNEVGSSKEEFIYLLDILSNYQLIKRSVNLRIRCTNHEQDENLLTNFTKAKKSYIHAWGFDPQKEKQLDSINIQRVERFKDCFSQEAINWEDSE